MSRLIPAGCLLLCAIPVSAALAGFRLNYWPLQWYGGTPDVVQPPSLTARFYATHEKALILVKYSNNHDVGDEWVYNDADIDNAAVVWARVIDPASDARLVNYFHGRSVWLLEPDKTPWLLQPYCANPAQPLSSNNLSAASTPRTCP